MEDCAITFLEKFNRGDTLEALQEIIPFPEVSYDNLYSENMELRDVIANYVDATTQGVGYFIDFLTNFQLQKVLKKNPSIMEGFPNVIPILQLEQTIFSNLILNDEEFLRSKQQLPLHIRAFCESFRKKEPIENLSEGFELQVDFFNSCINFRKHRPEITSYLPWYPYRFSKKMSPVVLSQGEMPLIFLEPFEFDFETLASRSSVFVLETERALMQMTQFPNASKILSDSKHFLYILEKHPTEQKFFQSHRRDLSFQPILFSKKTPLIEAMPTLCDALRANDSDWIYAVSKRILYKIREERYGKSRAAALESATNTSDWFSPYKKPSPPNVSQGPAPHDYFGKRLKELSSQRKPRNLQKRKKIRIAHIVSQVIEGGHAPTRLLEALLKYYDKDWFEIVLISTEILLWHPMEYPYKICFSPPSEERARSLLNEFQRNGITIYFIHGANTFEESAKLTSDLLKQHEVELAIFHSPQEIHTICAQITDVPVRILFDHGTPPKYPGFDMAIVSSYDMLNIYQDLHNNLNLKAYALPFAVNARAEWTPTIPTRKSLGIPENGFLMTTISNNLEARLGQDMCLAIAEILQSCPNAFYVPIGEMKNEEKFLRFFKEQGVSDRVLFMGHRINPSNIVRAMNLYLNEYPVGSGLSILDAMASGCPVVTMYDLEGPPQGRYGGLYFGMDYAITSNDRKDYVEIACRLINDKELYKKWSEHALQQYEKFSNIEKYVKEFEELLEKSMLHEP